MFEVAAKEKAQLRFEQALGKIGQKVGKYAEAGDNKENGKYLSRIRKRPYFAKPDRGHSDNRHIQCIQQGIGLDNHISRSADDHENKHVNTGFYQLGCLVKISQKAIF